jgi:hypothetical protein
MGPLENLTKAITKIKKVGANDQPASRGCLLSAERMRSSFHPRQSDQRHCSAECRKAARKWSRWKAQQRYRTTKSGKEKRSDQSRRYRQRVKHRKGRQTTLIG